jgi:hypothetical protein
MSVISLIFHCKQFFKADSAGLARSFAGLPAEGDERVKVTPFAQVKTARLRKLEYKKNMEITIA